MSMTEEIARLTGRLVFEVDNKPLINFESKLGEVILKIKSLADLTKNKLTLGVSVDKKAFRDQVDGILKSKIKISNVSLDATTLKEQKTKLREYLESTKISVKNVSVSKASLSEQKLATMEALGKISVRVTPQLAGFAHLRRDLKSKLKTISDENPLHVRMQLFNNNLAIKLRRAMIEAQKSMGELNIRVATPRVKLSVDKVALRDEIKQAIGGRTFGINVSARGGSGGWRRSGYGSGHGSSFFGHAGSHGGHSGFNNLTGLLSSLSNPGGGLGSMFSGLVNTLSPLTMALGSFGIATLAAGKTLNYLNERVEHRIETTAKSQQLNYALMASSEDPAEQERVRKTYVSSAMRYANEINVDSAKRYVSQVRALESRGQTGIQATNFLDDVAATFRAANLDKFQVTQANKEIMTAFTKGTLKGAQATSLLGSLGSVAGEFQLGVAKRNGYKGDIDGAAAFNSKGGHSAQFSSEDVLAGFMYAANATRAVQERHATSVEALQQQVENRVTLRREKIENDPELIAALERRIKAEDNLNKALYPLQKKFAALDGALADFTAKIINRLAGLNPDGTAKVDADAAASAGGEGAAVDPTAFNGTANGGWSSDPAQRKAQQDAAAAADPINKVYNWMTGVNQDQSGQGTTVNSQPDWYKDAFAKMQAQMYNPALMLSTPSPKAGSFTISIAAPQTYVTFEKSDTELGEDRVRELMNAALRDSTNQMQKIAENAFMDVIGGVRALQ